SDANNSDAHPIFWLLLYNCHWLHEMLLESALSLIPKLLHDIFPLQYLLVDLFQATIPANLQVKYYLHLSLLPLARQHFATLVHSPANRTLADMLLLPDLNFLLSF